MNAQRLYTSDGVATELWRCSKCGLVARDEGVAARCCTCIYCGGELGKGDFSTSHSNCFSLSIRRGYEKRLAEAEEVTHDGPVYCEHGGPEGDGYAHNIEQMAEWWDERIHDGEVEPESRPIFVMACTVDPPTKISVSDLVDRICEGGYEDMDNDVVIPDGLEAALASFNEQNAGLVSYGIDYKRKVRMPVVGGGADVVVATDSPTEA